MPEFFRNAPIQRKLMLIILGSYAAALLMTAAAGEHGILDSREPARRLRATQCRGAVLAERRAIHTARDPLNLNRIMPAKGAALNSAHIKGSQLCRRLRARLFLFL